MQIEQGNNSLRVKASNQSAILRTIYYYGPILRSEIAQRLDLTLPTITTNVSSMIDAGIVQETLAKENKSAGYGRRAHPVQIVPGARYFIGVETTGARCYVSVVNFSGKEVASYYDEEVCSDYEENMRRIGENTRRALLKKGLSWEKISGVCLALPGVIDREHGMLKIHPRNQWNEKNICADFAGDTGYQGRVTVENNACVRALGAQLYYSKELERARRFAYLFVDQGIACPLIITSSNFTGSVVGAGEVGHMVMVPNGRKCVCGNNGCLEAYASESAIITRCEEEMQQGRAQILAAICKSGEPTVTQVIEAQRQGDPDVTEIVENAIALLAVAVANIINFSSPDVVLIECKLFALAGNRTLLSDTAKKNLCNVTCRGTDLIFVDPDRASGARGAAAVAIDCSLD